MFGAHLDAVRKLQSGGYGFGIPSLDRILRGMRKGDLVLVFGVPGNGKTQLCLNLVLNNPGVRVLWVSPDESHDFIVLKFLCAAWGLPQDKVEAKLHIQEVQTEVERFVADRLANLHVEDAEASPSWFRDAIAWLTEQGKAPDIIVIDYVEEIDLPGADTRAKLAWLKKLAKTSNSVVVGIHQTTKAAIEHTGTPHLGLMTDGGHKEAIQAIYVRRPRIRSGRGQEAEIIMDPAERFQPSIEAWVLKNKRGQDGVMVRLAIEPGGAVTEWTREHEKRRYPW